METTSAQTMLADLRQELDCSHARETDLIHQLSEAGNLIEAQSKELEAKREVMCELGRQCRMFEAALNCERKLARN